MITSSIQRAVGFDRQLENLWELTILSTLTSFDDATVPFEADFVKVQAKIVSFGNPSFSTNDTGFGKKYYGKVTTDNTFSADIWLDSEWKSYNYFKDWMDRVYNSEGGYFNSFLSEKDYQDNCERDMFVSFQVPLTVPTIKLATRFNPYVSERLLDPVNVKIPGVSNQGISSSTGINTVNNGVLTGLEGYSISKRVIDPIAQAVPYYTLESTFVDSKTFFLKSCKILKIEDITGTYDTGNGMTVKVTMCFDHMSHE